MAKSPAPTKTPPQGSAGRPAGLFTWIAVGLVVVAIAVLVLIKVTTGPSSSATSVFQASDAATVAQVTQVPESVFNTVGITSAVATVTPPIPLKGQPPLTGTSSTGAVLPEVFYLGAEYCPFCAAERWSTIVALSRFGTWSGLGNTESSTLSGEAYPGTPSFTFLKAKFQSKYLVFRSVEQYNNVFDSARGYYSPLQKPTPSEAANFSKYDTSAFVPGMSSTQDHSIPYMTIGNKFIISGASYTPATLAGLTRSQIASALSDATNPVTVAIIATANFQTATFCELTKNHPASVCSSPGVDAAKRAMGLK